MRIAPILTILISMCLLVLLECLNMINYHKVAIQPTLSFILISPTIASITSIILCVASIAFASYRIYYVIRKRRLRKHNK